MIQTANEISDMENVQENTIQRNAITQQYNANIARIDTKHDAMNILHRLGRVIGLRSRGDARPISSSPNHICLSPRHSFPGLP